MISERKILQLWFDKLLEMNKTREQMIIRSDYMWFLLLMLQGKRIREPFSKLPPLKLPPLKHFVVSNLILVSFGNFYFVCARQLLGRYILKKFLIATWPPQLALSFILKIYIMNHKMFPFFLNFSLCVFTKKF